MTINPSFVMRNIYGRKILVPVTQNSVTDAPIVLNDIAFEIWNKAESCDDKDSLLNSIVRNYDLQEGSEEEKAVKAFIDQLIQTGLILV